MGILLFLVHALCVCISVVWIELEIKMLPIYFVLFNAHFSPIYYLVHIFSPVRRCSGAVCVSARVLWERGFRIIQARDMENHFVRLISNSKHLSVQGRSI